jgi:hypothetical protein
MDTITRPPVFKSGAMAFRVPAAAHAISESSELVALEQPAGALPLVIRALVDDVDLVEWAAARRDWLAERLHQYGGLLFRGFRTTQEGCFAAFLEAVGLTRMLYGEGATPRTQVADRIYTSTEHPADQTIALHNELSYVTSWPRRIFFHCETPPARDGETPIADVRRVLARIPRDIVERFERRGWMLQRNFGGGLSLSWQRSFHTDSRDELERYCRHAAVEWEWRPGDALRTRQVRPAIARHPITRDAVWFNHIAFWHVSSLPSTIREGLLSTLGENELPYNTYYGDGTPIEDEIVASIRAAYDAETRALPWSAGDMLMLDNMLVAHGRRPYAGPRRILAAMGDAWSDRGL